MSGGVPVGWVLVPVEQCDREAAWPWRAECYGYQDKHGWMVGRYDHDRAIQAFARHRLAAPASAPAGDGVEALLRRSRAAIAAMVPPDDRDSITRRLLADLATALARPRAAVGEREA